MATSDIAIKYLPFRNLEHVFNLVPNNSYSILHATTVANINEILECFPWVMAEEFLP